MVGVSARYAGPPRLKARAANAVSVLSVNTPSTPAAKNAAYSVKLSPYSPSAGLERRFAGRKWFSLRNV